MAATRVSSNFPVSYYCFCCPVSEFERAKVSWNQDYVSIGHAGILALEMEYPVGKTQLLLNWKEKWKEGKKERKKEESTSRYLY